MAFSLIAGLASAMERYATLAAACPRMLGRMSGRVNEKLHTLFADADHFGAAAGVRMIQITNLRSQTWWAGNTTSKNLFTFGSDADARARLKHQAIVDPIDQRASCRPQRRTAAGNRGDRPKADCSAASPPITGCSPEPRGIRARGPGTQLFALMAIRRTRSLASLDFGMVTVSKPLANDAVALSSSTSSSGM